MNKRVDATAFMSIELFGEILASAERLRLLMREHFNRQIVFNSTNISAGIGTVPLPQLINALERNLDLLAQGGYGAGEMQPTKTWHGETNDTQRLDYTDVNRWIETVDLIDRVINGIVARMPITGRSMTTGDRNSQIIRRVN
jgi:hypothetical protein